MTDEKRRQLESEARAYLENRNKRHGMTSKMPLEVQEKAVKAMAKALDGLEKHA